MYIHPLVFILHQPSWVSHFPSSVSMCINEIDIILVLHPFIELKNRSSLCIHPERNFKTPTKLSMYIHLYPKKIIIPSGTYILLISSILLHLLIYVDWFDHFLVVGHSKWLSRNTSIEISTLHFFGRYTYCARE